jgi:hypothetical protein
LRTTSFLRFFFRCHWNLLKQVITLLKKLFLYIIDFTWTHLLIFLGVRSLFLLHCRFIWFCPIQTGSNDSIDVFVLPQKRYPRPLFSAFTCWINSSTPY